MALTSAVTMTYRKTGIVYNITPRAVGVIIRKPVRNRYIEKRVNVRIEHVRHSKCRVDFLARVKANQKLIKEAKERGGKRVSLPMTH